MENNPNSLAYPREGYYDKDYYRQIPPENGLSKVELIAAMALQGMLSNPKVTYKIDTIVEHSVESAFLLLEKVGEISYNKKIQQLHKRK